MTEVANECTISLEIGLRGTVVLNSIFAMTILYFWICVHAFVSMNRYFWGSVVLYSTQSTRPVFPPAKRKERGEMAVEDVVSKFVLQRDLDHRDEFINFEVCAVDEDDEDVELPYVRYHSRVRKK